MKVQSNLLFVCTGFAVVSLAGQLAQSTIKLYDFWESVKNAPGEVDAILIDLKLLAAVLKDITGNQLQQDSGNAIVITALDNCKSKINHLQTIVTEFDAGFQSDSKRIRKWSAFKAVRKKEKLHAFRTSLGETKSTLTIAQQSWQQYVCILSFLILLVWHCHIFATPVQS